MGRASIGAYGTYDERRNTLRRGGGLAWPERNLKDHFQIGRTAEEVEAALTMVRRAPPPQPKPAPQLGNLPPPRNGIQFTYAEAAEILKISPAACYKRVLKHGWTRALAMGGPVPRGRPPHGFWKSVEAGDRA